MPIIRLIPSTYAVSNTSYLSVSNASNMYSNTDSTSYATIRHTYSSTSLAYLYLRGFNFDDIPSNAIINSFTVKIKGYESALSTSTSYAPRLANGTSALANTTASTTFNTSTGTITIPTGALTWQQILNYGDNFTILVYVRRSNRNTEGIFYCYGAEIEVDYSLAVTYDITSVNNSDSVSSITPEGTTEVGEGEDYTLTIFADSLGNIYVEDNGNDVTDQLTTEETEGGSYTFTGIPTSYDSERSSYDGTYEGDMSDGLSGYDSNTRICAYANTGSNAESQLVYNFDCSEIPPNAIINSVTCVATASCYSNGQYFNVRTLQLYNGTTAKGTAVTITGNGSTSAEHNINGGSWTRDELNSISIIEHIERGTSSTSTQASFSFWGATLTVNYTLPNQECYQYALTNISSDHVITVGDKIIIPPDEDPQKTYYPVTISSINATTEPNKGTTRVESGTTETITIYPSDPLLSLAIDNGVDITSQLVHHGGAIPDPTVTTAPNASYGFNLNSSTGYYVSTNAGVSRSAAVCRVTFDLPVRCLVTFQYINYAEGTYDFGVFGKIDTTLSTNAWNSSSSSGDSTTDAGLEQIRLNTNSSNTSTPQTLTYEIQSGEHYIDIKYGKDQASDENNDSLQWKITDIKPLEANDYYTYTLSNISEQHSLIFIFGNVTYYFVNSSTSTNSKLYPNGQMVQLPGDDYKLVIIPEDSDDTVTVTDNNTDVTAQLERKEVTTEKEGVSTTVVNYIYRLTNIQLTHNIVVSSSTGTKNVYINNSGWVSGTDILKKDNDRWSSIRYTRIYIHNGTAWIENAQRVITTNGTVFGGVITDE